MALSSFLDRFNEPETLRMAQLGRELRARGIDVIDMSLGEPDFDTPAHIKEAAIAAIRENYTHYTPVAGFADLRQAVCYKLKRDNQLDYAPEQIVVSTGAKQSLANVVLSLVDENDEVVIPTPFWVTYSELVKIARGKVVAVRTTAESGFKISPQQLENAITPKTRLFMFSSPCNPSGAVYTQEELQALVAVFERHPQVYIISDEIYEYINFRGSHGSIASFQSIHDRVIVINGLSKGFAMTGWRLGYMAASVIIAKACEKVQGQFTSGANSITQKAAVVALTTDLRPTLAMVEEFAKRKALVLDLLQAIPGVICPSPDGAFYVFPNMRYYFGKTDGETIIQNAADLSMYLLHKAHVSSVMGDAFGEPDCVRFSFANSRKNIEEGWRRISVALASLQAP
ncbi:MAG: pyridoxal phosphate-dependent aminotransferase [Sphingomonadales bacterium]